ncbi:MAG: hypothetical protein M1130_09380 [Actinobacteria bacterium]|nr:hypothetical protein [Actinomycetota bacterium]
MLQNTTIPQSRFKPKTRFLLITALLLLSAGAALWAVIQSTGGGYGGWITGLVPEEQGSSLVAYDPIDNRSKLILALPEVAPDNYGAVSPDGKYAAYTQWNGTGTVRYLVVQKLTGFKKSREYFKDVSGMQEVTCLSWLPDSSRLLFVRKDVTETFPYQEICIFDVLTGKITTVDSGGLWDGRSIKEVNGREEWVGYMPQEQLDQLVSKYGGQKIAIEQINRKLWVEFSAPSISPDGEKVVYSATLARSSADEGGSLRCASGIWVAGEKGAPPHRIYANPDQSYAVNSVIWTSYGKALAFIQLGGPDKGEGKIDYLDLSTNNIKTIVHTTQKHQTNLQLLAMPGNEISFLSAPLDTRAKDGQRYVINPETGEIRPQQIKISPKGNQLLNFSSLYQESP